MLIFVQLFKPMSAKIGSVRVSGPPTGFDGIRLSDPIELNGIWSEMSEAPTYLHSRNPDFRTRLVEVSREDFFPVYKEASSQRRICLPLELVDQDTQTYLKAFNKDYSTQHGQPILFLILWSYDPHLTTKSLIMFCRGWPCQTYYLWTYKYYVEKQVDIVMHLFRSDLAKTEDLCLW